MDNQSKTPNQKLIKLNLTVALTAEVTDPKFDPDEAYAITLDLDPSLIKINSGDRKVIQGCITGYTTEDVEVIS